MKIKYNEIFAHEIFLAQKFAIYSTLTRAVSVAVEITCKEKENAFVECC